MIAAPRTFVKRQAIEKVADRAHLSIHIFGVQQMHDLLHRLTQIGSVVARTMVPLTRDIIVTRFQPAGHTRQAAAWKRAAALAMPKRCSTRAMMKLRTKQPAKKSSGTV